MPLSAVVGASTAVSLPVPTGEVLLTVEGRIGRTSDGERAHFDRALLEGLGLKTIVTTNPFVEGVHRYDGVLLSDVLDRVGATGTVLVAKALDGYSIDIPIADARAYPVLLAMKRDGATMGIRQKGPIWIVYPLDQHPELRTENVSVRSVWQLTTLTVR